MAIVRAFLVVVLIGAFGTAALATEGTRKIDWDTLIPEMTPLDNPFEALDIDQRTDFEILIGIRDMQRRGIISEVNETFEDGIQIRQGLTRQGLDVDGLIAEYDRLEREVRKRNKMTNASLNGQMVRIPGYALPLEHKDTGVKELLLVPYVGACIHVPPPPPNQIVYVTLKDSFTAKDLYEPVWITGRMSVKQSNKMLSFVDGAAGIDTAYTLEGVTVEPYKE